VIPEAAGAAIGGGALLGGEAAGLTAADFSLGLGESLAGGLAGAGGAGAAGLTAADFSAGLGESLAGGLAGGAAEGIGGGLGLDAALGAGGIEGAGGSLVPGGALTGPAGALTTGAAAPQAALPAVSAGTAVGGPVAAAPVAPASIGTVAPTVTGDLTGAATGGGVGTDADYAAINAAPGMSGGSDAGGTAAAGSKGGLIDRTLSSLTGGAVSKSDLGTVLSGGGLLMNLMGGNKSLPGEKQLSGAAAGLSATAAGQAALGSQLEGFLQSGKLPPGVESGLRSATHAAEATIKSQHAARGTSGSSAEASEIQAANDRALEAGQKVALQLLQQGATMVQGAASTEGLAASLYQTILGNALEKDREFGQALGNFSSALARSDQPQSITLKAA
jgi:hypothetical protein